MFLRFLEKIGRKKIVLDRGPSHPNFGEAKTLVISLPRCPLKEPLISKAGCGAVPAGNALACVNLVTDLGPLAGCRAAAD